MTPLPSEGLSSHTGCFGSPVELCPKDENKKQENGSSESHAIYMRGSSERSETFLPLRAGGTMDAPLGFRSSSRGICPIIIQNSSEVWDLIGGHICLPRFGSTPKLAVYRSSHSQSPPFFFFNLVTAESKPSSGESSRTFTQYFDPNLQRASLLRQPRALTASQLGDPSARLTGSGADWTRSVRLHVRVTVTPGARGGSRGWH